MEGIRRALFLGLLLIAVTAIEQAPSVGPHPSSVSFSVLFKKYNNNNNNNNCLKSNIQCIEIRVQWTVHLGNSHMHVHALLLTSIVSCRACSR